GMPPLVMLLALKAESCLETGSRVLPMITGGCLAMIAAITAVGRHFCYEDACQAASLPVIAMVVAYALLGGFLCRRLDRRWCAPLLGAYVFLLLPPAVEGVNLSGDRLSQKAVADFLKQSSYNTVAMYQDFEKFSALAFYLDAPLVMVD